MASTSGRVSAPQAGRPGRITTLRRSLIRTRMRLSGGQVLPRRSIGSRDYAVAGSGARWFPVEAAAPISRRPPVRFGRRPGDFTAMLAASFPEMGVLELPDAYLVGPRGWVVTRDRYLLPDHTLFLSPDEMRINDLPGRVSRVRGTVASLASDNAWRNYGHFLYDSLPRVELLRRAGFSVRDIDWFYVGVPGRKARRLVERLGIPAERIIPAAVGQWVQAERLLAPTFPGARFDHPRWVIEFLRRELLPAGATIAPSRRLYVRRTRSRRIVNESEIMPILGSHGFQPYEPEAHDEPPMDFAQAEAVVSVHGANLADICFCPEGARVLELTPTDHIHSYWYAQAETAGLEHAYLVCPSVDQRAPGATRESDRDIRVDADELAQALGAMLGPSSAS